MIELQNVTKRFANKVAVKNLNMEIIDGEITMLIGPSGCGKTTTLRMINRLIESTEGDILINKKSIRDMNPVELRRGIGYVIQEIGLFPHMNVFDNIAIVPRLVKWEEKKIKQRVEELLDMVTLDSSYIYKYPLQLSGGERQRIALARALAADPDILLMDEPFGAIDPINRDRLHDSFIEIQEKIKKTIVFVTHDINEAIKLGDKIAILRNGELVQHDNVHNILYNPENSFVERLLGHDRNIKALVLKRNIDYIKTDDHLEVRNNRSPERVKEIMAEKCVTTAYVTDADQRLKGFFIFDKNKKQINFNDNLIRVEQYNNLQETLSLMIEAGESQLPVVSKRNKFIGIIKLEDIFREFNDEK